LLLIVDVVFLTRRFPPVLSAPVWATSDGTSRTETQFRLKSLQLSRIRSGWWLMVMNFKLRSCR
jgi:hypothetical protein